jgi:acyl-CoA synthetase (AMP-forming)/AMP-acid ligase II
MEFNLADLFETVADTVPDNEAIVCGTRRVTYRQLDERANRLAHWLQGRGVRPGEHVGVYLYNGPEYLEASLACFKIRAVPINVNYRYVEEELAYLFDNADLVGLIHHREFTPRIASVLDTLRERRALTAVDDGSDADLASTGSEDYEAVLAGSSPERGFPPRSPDDLYVLYTGGTTGMPKGVLWRSEDIFFGGLMGGDPMGEPIRRPEEIADKVRKAPPMTALAIAPLMHGACQWATFISLFAGQRVVLSDRKNFDPDYLWELVERERVNTISIVGDAMGRPLAEALERAIGTRDLSSVFVVGSGGAVFSKPVKLQLKQHLPNVVLLDSFGASETGAQGRGVADPDKEGSPTFQMGERSQVFDDDLKPVEPGSGRQGKLALRGHIPLGYYKDETKTAATFAVIDGERWVMPGDIATVEADGTITVFGRGSVCINSGGEKIFPEEVEAALKSHPAIFDVLVVGVPDERFGQRVAAVIEPREGTTPDLEDVQRHARSKVAGYKVPRELHLVKQVVRSPSGKPDYRWAKAVATGEAR